MGFRDPITDVATGTDISNVETLVNTVKAKTDNLPATPANEAGKVATVETRVAGAAALEATAQSILALIDTEVAAILAAVDTEVAAIKAKTDTLGVTTGLPGYRVKSAPTSGVVKASGSTSTIPQPTSGAGSNTWGSYAEIIASTAWDAYVIGAYFWTLNIAQGLAQFARGGAGSETPFLEVVDRLTTNAGQHAHLQTCPIPFFIPAGTRLSVRSLDSIGNYTHYGDLLLVRASDLEAF